ncbi:uncharacterized protein LOC105663856 isoform X2 [Megachile rotundata]|uniref:uncharacterized protein LOC105663856 isoform X2 n=1 Tax=Megachile rotundata TaxID=143995 RepID=UPI003FD678AE
MKLFHPSNVYDESWLLLAVMKLLGLYPIKSSKHSYINYIYQILLHVVYSVLFFKVNSYANNMYQTLSINPTIIAKRIRYFINVLLLPIITMLSARHISKLRRVFEQIDKVDKNIQFFNKKIDYSSCMRNDVIQTTATILTVILSNLTNYYGFLDYSKDYMYVLMWMLDYLADFVNTIIICSFGIIIDKIKVRFKEINADLNVITKENNYISFSESSDVNSVSRFKLLKVLRFELCKAASLVNETYEFRFRILAMIYLIYICLHVNIIYSSSDNMAYVVDIALSLIWGILDLIKFVYVIHLHRFLTTQRSNFLS